MMKGGIENGLDMKIGEWLIEKNQKMTNRRKKNENLAAVCLCGCITYDMGFVSGFIMGARGNSEVDF